MKTEGATGLQQCKNLPANDSGCFRWTIHMLIAMVRDMEKEEANKQINAHATKLLSLASMFEAMDQKTPNSSCETKLISFSRGEYYCRRCRGGKCDRCSSSYRPVYELRHGSTLFWFHVIGN